MSTSVTINKNVKYINSLLKSLYNYWEIINDLAKVRITLMVAVTTIVGYILYATFVDWNAIITTFGVFILACGSAVLNEFQEYKTDALMQRTKSRPIPSNRISANNALKIALLFIVLGLGLLFFVEKMVAGIGLLTLGWYNFIYTPLKHKHALAIIPGAIIGALPPLIGWVAAGGDIFAPSIIAFASFLFIWQIPHFWLLLLIYDNDYKAGGFPTLTEIFTKQKLARLTFSLILIMIACSFGLLAFSIKFSLFNILLLSVLAFVLLQKSRIIIKNNDKYIFRKTFLYINFYVLLVLLTIVIDKVLIL